MYDKKYEYNQANGKSHIIKNLKSWFGWIERTIQNFDKLDKEKKKKIAEQIFESIYKNTEYFWGEEEFTSWINKELQSPKCHYCGSTLIELKPFYNHVNSYRWQRGRNFEIDRKHGFMVTFLKEDKCKEEEFIKNARTEIEKAARTEIENFDTKGLSNKYYLYLPAPYNSENCVLACAWCNNAKTDAFTEEEFKPIGKMIGKQIAEIAEKISQQ
ncbi:MAG: hypothetical protein LBG92_08825 [Prevotellaceae bacterium]|jgi:hypothetical protein|nr:hypothetical protein [Prevotellaceae bacterium]